MQMYLFAYGSQVKLSGKTGHSADMILVDHSLVVTALGETVIR